MVPEGAPRTESQAQRDDRNLAELPRLPRACSPDSGSPSRWPAAGSEGAR
jgi:hypothetical protein